VEDSAGVSHVWQEMRNVKNPTITANLVVVWFSVLRFEETG
jgi:hypothetical protein